MKFKYNYRLIIKPFMPILIFYAMVAWIGFNTWTTCVYWWGISTNSSPHGIWQVCWWKISEDTC